MKKSILIMIMLMVLPTVSWAQSPSNEELYQMIKKMEQKLDAAIDETNKAKAEAAAAKKEAATAKEELARIKGSPAAVSEESLVRAADTKPGIEASFDVLYMRPSRSNLDFVIVDPNTDTNPQGRLKEIDPDYQWGGRLGLKYDFGSGTDIGAQYMRFRSDDKSSAILPNLSTGRLWGTWLHPDSIIGAFAITSATASYDVDYDVIDLGVGKWLDIGNDFGLRIDGGLRYAKIDQDMDIFYHNRIGVASAVIENENKFSGWGGRVGLDLDWRFGPGFSIFGSAAGSVLVGNFDLSLRETDYNNWPFIPPTVTVPASIKQNKSNRVVPVVELRAGIGYAYELENGWDIGAEVGYEWQNWFNMVMAKRWADDIDDQNLSTDTTDFGLDGFFLKGFVHF